MENLTPEEMAELEAEFGESSPAEVPADTALSPEEMAQLDSEFSEAPIDGKPPLSDFKIDLPDRGPNTGGETTRNQAIGLNVLESVPFAKDIASSIHSMSEIVETEDYSIEQFKEGYNQQMDQYNSSIKHTKEKYPYTSFAADVAGSLAFPVGTSKLGLAAFGAASGLSRSEEREIDDAITGGIYAYAGGALAGQVGEAGRTVMASGAGKAATALFRKHLTSAGAKGQKLVRDHLKNMYGAGKVTEVVDEVTGEITVKHGPSMKEAMTDFYKDMQQQNILRPGDTLDDTLVKIKTSKLDANKEMNKFIQMADDAAPIDLTKKYPDGVAPPKAPIIDTKELYDEIIYNAERELGGVSSTAVQNKALEKIYKDMGRLVTKDPETGAIIGRNMSLSDINAWNQNLSKGVAFVEKSALKDSLDSVHNGALKNATASIRGTVERNVDNLLIGNGSKAEGAYKLAKRKYGNLKAMGDIVEDKISGADVNLVSQNLAQMLTVRRGLFAVGALGVASNPVAATALLAVNAVATSPKMQGSYVKGLERLSTHLTNNPLGPVATRLGAVTGIASLTDDILNEEVSVAMAQATLRDKPLKRTNADLIANANAISTLLRDMDPNAAQAFNKARREGDDVSISQIGAMLAKMPEAEGLIEEGQGWEGKLYDPAEIQAATNEVEANKDMSLAQRLMHKKALKQSGTIPQPQPEEDKFLMWKSNRGEDPKI